MPNKPTEPFLFTRWRFCIDEITLNSATSHIQMMKLETKKKKSRKIGAPILHVSIEICSFFYDEMGILLICSINQTISRIVSPMRLSVFITTKWNIKCIWLNKYIYTHQNDIQFPMDRTVFHLARNIGYIHHFEDMKDCECMLQINNSNKKRRKKFEISWINYLNPICPLLSF